MSNTDQVIDCLDGNRAGCSQAIDVPVIDGKTDRAICLVGVFRAVKIRHRGKCCLVVSNGRGTAQCQHTCRGAVAACDSVLVREAKAVFTRLESTGDRNRRTLKIDVVHISQRQCSINDRRRIVLDIAQSPTSRDRRRVVNRGDSDSHRHGGFFGGGAAAEPRVGAGVALIVDRDLQRILTVEVQIARIFQRRQCGVDIGLRAGEGQGTVAAIRVGEAQTVARQ